VGPIGKTLQLVAVFDGHGGEAVAEHCARTMPEAIIKQLTAATATKGSNDDVMVNSLATAFAEVDGRAAHADHVGSTACVVLIGDHHIWCANAGDSRAVLASGGRAIPLSRDHKPELAHERQRIEGSGGVIVHDGYCYRVQGVLNVSRGIGDRTLQPYVTSLPEVACATRNPTDDRYVMVASDGLWDVFSSDEAILHMDGFLRDPNTRVEVALQLLVKEARRRGSTDNITAIVHRC
jgi:serine/threonine protein phosphatase PrpC